MTETHKQAIRRGAERRRRTCQLERRLDALAEEMDEARAAQDPPALPAAEFVCDRIREKLRAVSH